MKYRVVEHRPVTAVCVVCGRPIYGKRGKYDPENMILMDNGDVLHDRADCGIAYLRRHYLFKG